MESLEIRHLLERNLRELGFKFDGVFLYIHGRLEPDNKKIKEIFSNSPEGFSIEKNVLVYRDKSRGIVVKSNGDLENIKKQLKEYLEQTKILLGIQEKNYLYERTHEIIKEITKSKNLEALYGKILSEMCELVNADLGAVTRYDGDKNLIYAVKPGYKVSSEEMEFFQFELEEGTAAYRAYQNKSPLCINDAKNEPEILQKYVEYFNVQRVCIVPLLLEDRIFGFIYIAKQEGSSPLENYEVGLLDFLSSQIVNFLKFFHTFDKATKRLNALTQLEKATRVILSEMNVEKVIKLITRFLVELFEVDASSLMVLDESENNFIIKDSTNLSDNFVNNQKIPFKEVDAFVSESREKTFYIKNMQKKPFGNLEVIKEEGLISTLAQPFFIDGKLYGVLNLYTEEEKSFSDIDRELMVHFGLHVGIAIKNSKLFNKSIKTTESLINTLAALESEKDYYTAQHSKEVADIATSLGKACGLKEDELENLYIAGLLHDLGKISVDNTILLKEKRLTCKEMKRMKKHPGHARSIIEKIPNMEDVANCVYYHHERWDGEGYPEGLEKREIPICSRILNIADSVAAMLSDRPYRNALNREEVRKELKSEKGKQFDPELIEKFLEIF